MKNFLSVTPCSLALNALILELIDSAEAFVEIVQYFIVMFISYSSGGKANSLRERNSYQMEIDAATKRIAEWETRYKAEHNMSPLAQTVPHPICHGMIMTKTNTNNRNPKVGDKTSPYTQ